MNVPIIVLVYLLVALIGNVSAGFLIGVRTTSTRTLTPAAVRKNRTPRRTVILAAASSGSSSSSKVAENDDDEDEDELSLEAFQKAKNVIEETATSDVQEDDAAFDGYDFRDILFVKWGKCFDVEFNRVESFGFRKVYLNILPFHLGRRPFRHATEYDYLCHLQAVVEILQEYGQLEYVLAQIGETNKRPIPGRSPIVAVPCRLDLTEDQVNSILGITK